MTLRIDTTLRNQRADNACANFNAGTLKLYTGAQPANADAAATGTLLVTITLPNPAFAAAASGSAAMSGTWSANAVADGTIGWGRMENAGATIAVDGSVTVGGGGGDFIVDNTAALTGNPITVTDATWTEPANA